ncbi:MAG: T9SS type B sorting domain-containing protein, partial [Chitinophagaceae bacterium]
ATFDRVEISFGALVSALSNLSIYGAEIIYPNPTIAAAGLNICSGNSAVLTATANGGTTLEWYSAPTGGTLLQTGSTYSTPVLNATTTYYIEVSKAGCSNPERFPVKVTVANTPAVPVVAAVPSVCVGSTAVISVTSPVAGVTYSWFTTATGGTAIATGAQFTTPAVTANITYYVEASNGTCVNSTRKAVPVTTKPLPALPQVQASATTVNSGQTAVLTASSSEANITFNWYTSANGTTPVYTGPIFITPPLTATTTYYLEAVSSNGCPAASRVQVTITVNGGGGPNPVPCEAATTQTNGVTGGISLFAGVFNPLLAIDDDSRTASSLVAPVGLLGTTVFQRIGFTTLSNIGDTVRVLLSSPGKLLSLGVLSNITIGTYAGNTNNNDAVSLGNALIRLELLSGSNEALISFVPTKQFDKVDIRLNSGLVGALASINVNYVQRVLVTPTVVASNVTACLNQSAVLTVQNPKAGLIYKWYDAAGVYQAGKDGTTFNTPAITANTTYYVTANTANGCASAKTAVTVTVTLPPATPVLASPTVNTCSGSDVVLAVSNPISGVTYKWYNSAGVYQAGKDGPTFTITGVTAATTYSVEAVNSCGIASTRATATINIGTINSPTVVPSAVTVSAGTPAVLTASSSTAGAVFNWYTTAGGTTPVFVGSRFETPPLINNGTTPITVTYYVEAVVPGGCPASARTSVVITVIPTGTGADVPCERATAQVRSGVDGIALFTGVFNPALAVDNNSATASSLVMPVGVLGASVYQHVRFDNLSAIGDTLRVRVSSPGKLLSLAVLPAIELTTYNGLTSNNDTYLASNPLVRVELLSDNSGAIFSFVPAKQFNGVELRLRAGIASVLTSLDFNYAQLVIKAPQVLSASASACVGTSATLTVRNPVAGLTYRWYRGTTYLTGKDGIILLTDPTLAAGVYDYFVTASRNGCESAKTKVVVTILAAPALPIPAADNPTVACFNSPVTLKVTPIAGVQFNWYDAPTAGNLLAANTNTYTTAANLAPGVYNFYVEAFNSNNCGNAGGRTKITLTVNSTSVAADISIAGLTSAYCAGTRATLTASSTTVTNPVFTWYSDAALTNPVFTGPVFQTPVLSANLSYYVTVRGDGKCENLAAAAKVVAINVNPPALAADISVSGAGAPVCAPASVVLTASSSTIINPTFTWYSDAALTTVVHTGATFTTPVLNASATYYVTVQSATRCENTAATARVVTVTVNPVPVTPIVAAAGTNICSGDPAILSVQNAQAGVVYTWYDAATGGSVLFTGPQFTTGPLTANKDYYVSATSPSGCGMATGRVKVTVTVSAKPLVPTVASSAIAVCAGNTATITVTNPQAGVTYSYYTTATGSTALGTGNTYTTGVVTAATTIYVGASVGSCSSTSRTAVTITPATTPVAPVSVAGAETQLCAGSSATLTVQNPVASVVYRWYAAAAGGTALAEGVTFTTPALNVTTNYYVEAANTAGCASTTRTAVTVNVTAKLAAPVVTVASMTSTSVTFSWNAVAGATGYEVSVDNGLTWISTATATSYTVSGLQAGQNATIRVRAKGALDCQTSDATTLTGDTDNPQENTVFIPNTFTPNNDGKNDILYVYGNSIAKLKLRVYNQWGQFIYESLNVANGWNGTYRGEIQPNGVYVYYAEVEFNDGSKVSKKGTITLLR